MKLKKALTILIMVSMLLNFGGCSKNLSKSHNKTDDVQKEIVLTKDENSQRVDNKSENITPETEIKSEEILAEKESNNKTSNNTDPIQENNPIKQQLENSTVSSGQDNNQKSTSTPSSDLEIKATQNMKQVHVTCEVYAYKGSLIEDEKVELSVEVPEEWSQDGPGGQFFYHEDGNKAAEGFFSEKLPEGKTIEETIHPELSRGYISSDTININGKDILYDISKVPWGKEVEPPDELKTYCYGYYLPYRDSCVLVQIYSVGLGNQDTLQLHKEILESIQFQ